MAFGDKFGEKIANGSLKEPLIRPEDWEKIVGKRQAFGTKLASSGIRKFAAEQSKYLLSHVTIMASVQTEAEPYDYLIKPETSIYVNGNNDSWENTVLKLSYRSFIGGFNFLEHFQNSKYAKGHILDAVLRKMDVAPGVWIYYVDLLVATDLKHEDLVSNIRDGKVRYLSMGCITAVVLCSFCGCTVKDEEGYCQHLISRKGSFLTDDDGISRIVAELCGHKSLPNGGVSFVEASWVGTPAFPGAAVRGIVADEWLGPKTPYTAKAASAGIAKAASLNNLSPTDSMAMAEFKQRMRF
jgi:hypothetical protein